MKKRLQNIINKAAPAVLLFIIIAIWQGVSFIGILPEYMMPSPLDVVKALLTDMPLLMHHAKTTLAEAFIGLGGSIFLSFVTAFFMDRFIFVKKAVYPLLVVSQTIPTVAIAPLLVLWLGYGIAPKVMLIIITCYFPLTVSLLAGLASADNDAINLLRAMGASKNQIFYHIKLKSSFGHFFSGLKVAVSYSVVGAVISEWLGGMSGLGVYMTRVKKSYAFDKMFAVILLISVISLLLMKLVTLIEKVAMPWNKVEE